MVPKIQMETEKPSTTMNIPFRLEPSPINATDIKTGPLSLEIFNCAANDLNDKGIINLKNIVNISTTSPIQCEMEYAVDKKMPKTLFVQLLTDKANMLKKHLKDTESDLRLCTNISYRFGILLQKVHKYMLFT